MLRSMFSAVSAIKTHQTKMDVIGDNVANVNTIGFKSSRATFSSVFSSVIKTATAADQATGRGGSNPMQVGLGVSLSSIDVNMARGSLQRTDNPTDLAIEGNGFFVVGGDAGANRFTRAGNFTIDSAGNLVTASGLNVLGWMYNLNNKTIDTTKTPGKINILSSPTIAPTATDKIRFEGNLDADTAVYTGTIASYEDLMNVPSDSKYSMSFKVYDSQGKEHTLQLTLINKGNNTWTYVVDAARQAVDVGTAPSTTKVYKYVDETLNIYTVDTTNADNYNKKFLAFGEISFNKDGTFNTITSPDTTLSREVSGSVFTVRFKDNVVEPIKFDVAKTTFDINDSTNNAFFLNNITQYSINSSITAAEMSGYGAGTLQGYSIDSSGKITGIYSNGRNELIGQIALANFANPTALQRIGDNLYINTVNSGEPDIGAAGTGSRGTISSGTLEMSNVDLAKEFTEMITTQRGYQANARIITASDELLQDLVNLKR